MALVEAVEEEVLVGVRQVVVELLDEQLVDALVLRVRVAQHRTEALAQLNELLHRTLHARVLLLHTAATATAPAAHVIADVVV